MSISKEEAAYIAKLARLDLTPEEMDGLTKDLGEILEYVGRLSALESATAGRAAPRADAAATPFREDHVLSSLAVEDALRPAADHDGEFFRVPPVIDRESGA
jgi:aspartyl-tRNA(Asn)/glutamyl-tRNA(Gln) amidotransferase subunit C